MMRKKITKIEKDLKALNKWLVGDKKKAKKKAEKKSKEKNDLLKRVNAMMTEPIPQRLRVEFLG
jgi:hypothetical protein